MRLTIIILRYYLKLIICSECSQRSYAMHLWANRYIYVFDKKQYLLSPQCICSTGNYVKFFEVHVGTSLNIRNLQGDTAVTTTGPMYKFYRHIIQRDTGVFARLLSYNSFISELKIFFKIPKCS